MKIDEVKIRVKRFLDDAIDLYFPKNTVMNKFMNATAKVYIENKVKPLGDMLHIIADDDGEIDANMVLCKYEEALLENGEFRVNIKEMFEDQLGSMSEYLPNKVILFKKEDIQNIFK